MPVFGNNPVATDILTKLWKKINEAIPEHISVPDSTFALLPIMRHSKAIKNSKSIKCVFVFGIWGIVSILLSFICEPNINRLNILMFPIIFYTVLGIYEVVENTKWLSIILLVIYTIFFGLYLHTYILFSYKKMNEIFPF